MTASTFIRSVWAYPTALLSLAALLYGWHWFAAACGAAVAGWLGLAWLIERVQR